MTLQLVRPVKTCADKNPAPQLWAIICTLLQDSATVLKSHLQSFQIRLFTAFVTHAIAKYCRTRQHLNNYGIPLMPVSMKRLLLFVSTSEGHIKIYQSLSVTIMFNGSASYSNCSRKPLREPQVEIAWTGDFLPYLQAAPTTGRPPRSALRAPRRTDAYHLHSRESAL